MVERQPHVLISHSNNVQKFKRERERCALGCSTSTVNPIQGASSSRERERELLRPRMGCICEFNPLNTQIFYSFLGTKPRRLRTDSAPSLIASGSYTIRNSHELTSSTTSISTQATQIQIPKSGSSYNVKFKTLGACKLGIARYPDFAYNAEGGTGTGQGGKRIESNVDDEISVSFDVETLYIPPLSSETTKFLGLPLPPFLKIEIFPEFFGGVIGEESGKVDLEFKAKFCFSVGSIYRAPPLIVKTVLTSEESTGTIRSGRGKRLNEEGECRLVGVATVDPIDDFFMNTFLGLPTECLADLSAMISFSGPSSD